MRQPDAIEHWVCYHVIGERSAASDCRLAARSPTRFAARLASEPTVLAPIAAAEPAAAHRLGGRGDGRRGRRRRLGGLSTLDPPPTAIAKAREAATVRAAQVRPQAVPPDYLLAHQEYSPTTQIQGIGPVLRPRRGGIGRCRAVARRRSGQFRDRTRCDRVFAPACRPHRGDGGAVGLSGRCTDDCGRRWRLG